LTIGTAITVLYVPSALLVPALKSEWLVIHVSAARLFPGGVFLLSNVIAAAYLYLTAKGRTSSVGKKRLPDLETLDQLSYRLVAFVFSALDLSQLSQERFGLKAHGVVTGAGIQKRRGHLLLGLPMRHTYTHA
jgi:hypothetical protein